jgi:sugar phosphate isomerase/epimerase
MIRLSCCQWGLNKRPDSTEVSNLNLLAGLGFRAVDICPSMQRTEGAKATARKLGIEIGCISISHEAPQGSTFDSNDPTLVEPLTRHTKQAISHASSIGAEYTYVVPGPLKSAKTYSHYAHHFSALADHGQSLGVKVGIEHFPGTVFATVKSTLDFIHDVAHPNLYLLFDIGHAQITDENPVDILPRVGDRLLYVHLDDNDGKNDLHLALTDGVQSLENVETLFKVLNDIGYQGFASLEMHPDLPDPLDAVRRSLEIIVSLLY